KVINARRAKGRKRLAV
ncbi:50S ribosomal protein L34, partial [Campylobacter jejuni]|nr:50S ribosomal protein L34 [Campylobacter jejuni]EHV5186588.1 50S ribosomal protein L34 [Campylobacter jejuni]